MAKKKSRVARTRQQMVDQKLRYFHDVPPECLPAYVEVHQWAKFQPRDAHELLFYEESDWDRIMIGIIWPDPKFALRPDAAQAGAWALRANSILQNILDPYGWPKPIAAMTPDEIIAQLWQDAEDGLITRKGDSIELHYEIE